MPYGQSPWEDVSNAGMGVGNSMRNIMLAQQQGQFRQQEFLAQQAYQQARLQIERDQLAEQARANRSMDDYRTGELKLATNADTRAQNLTDRTFDVSQRLGRLQGYRGTPDLMSLVRDPQSAAQLFGDLRTAGVMAPGAQGAPTDVRAPDLQPMIIAALRAQATQAMGANPMALEHMMAPVPANAYGSVDPLTMQKVAPGYPKVQSQFETGKLGLDQQRTDAYVKNQGDRSLNERQRTQQNILHDAALTVLGMKKNYMDDSPLFEDAQTVLANSLKNAKGQPAVSGPIKQPKSKAEYDALKSGDVYVDTDGQTKRKK